MTGNNGVVVTRTLNKPESIPTGSYDSEYYEGIYYYPAIPHVNFNGLFSTIIMFEMALLILTFIAGGIFIIFMLVNMNKYRCPRCKKPYFLRNKIPEYCTRCGAKLALPKVEPLE